MGRVVVLIEKEIFLPMTLFVVGGFIKYKI